MGQIGLATCREIRQRRKCLGGARDRAGRQTWTCHRGGEMNRWIRSSLLSASLLLLSAAALTSCVDNKGVPKALDELQTEFDTHRLPALRCAEKQAAHAQANLDFAEYEASRGEVVPAVRALKIVRANIDEAIEIIGDRQECFGIYDRDGDGIIDEEDNCPDVPNPDQADL